jgi:hypothetical protein
VLVARSTAPFTGRLTIIAAIFGTFTAKSQSTQVVGTSEGISALSAVLLVTAVAIKTIFAAITETIFAYDASKTIRYTVVAAECLIAN